MLSITRHTSYIRFTRRCLTGAALLLTVTHAGAESAPDPLEAIVVTATRQATRANELLADVSIVNRETIERSGASSVAELLARQPGIQTMNLGGLGSQTELFVRGARSDQTKILVDGVAVNSMDLRGSPLRFMSIDQVDRIEILRGPAGAVHGSDAIGGVIQIFTRRAEDGLHGDAFVGGGTDRTEKASGGISFGNARWSARVFAHEHRTQGFSAVRNATRQDADNDGYRNGGGGANISFRPAPGHELALSSMSNHGEAHFDGTTGAGTFDSRYMFKNEVWNLSSRNRITENWDSLLRWGNSIDEQNTYTSALASGFSPLRTTNKSLSWQNDVRLPLGTGLVVIESQEQNASPASRFPTNNRARIDAMQLGWTARLGPHRWQLGARQDKHSRFGDASTGLASYGYQIDDLWRAHVATSSSFRAPTLYQLYANIAGALVANPLLQPEHAHNSEFGIVRESGLHTLSLTAFHNRVRDMIDYDAPTLSYRNISRARLRGWTLAYQGEAGPWSLSSSLDYLDAIDGSTGLRLGRRAKTKANLSVARQLGDWNLGAEAQLVGRRFDRDNETRPLGGYGLVNLTAKWAMNEATALELRADNVFDKFYTNALSANGRIFYATPGASVFAGLRYNY